MKTRSTSRPPAGEERQSGVNAHAGAQLKQAGAASMPDARAASLAQLQHQQRASNSGQAAQLKARAEMMAERGGDAPAQRVEDEELLQGKFAVAQREEDEELLQGKFAPVQREEDEELLQGKFAPVQREVDEELLQGKFAPVQRMDEEEPLQGKFEALQGRAAGTPLQGRFETASASGVPPGTPVQRKEKPNNTGLPDQLKSGIESLSGLSMDHVKVHYNSDKPSQLQAHAYAQGSEIHVAPGQERHVPHEAWHVVQQAQGRVKPTLQMKGGIAVNDDVGLEKEADLMGAQAMRSRDSSNPQLLGGNSLQLSTSEVATRNSAREVIQGAFAFRVNPDNHTIVNTRYNRTFGKYLIGNSEHKHVTADSVKDELWSGLEGTRIDVFVQKLMDIVDVYLALPGVDLIYAHVLDDSNSNSDSDSEAGSSSDSAADDLILDEDISGSGSGSDSDFDEEESVGEDDNGINGPMTDNFEAFDQVHNILAHDAANLFAWKGTFLEANKINDKQGMDAAAFHIQNLALDLIDSLDKFRDLMPLVNVISGLQKRGSEKEAKLFLKTGRTTVHVQSENAALWAFFDFAAIDEMAGDDEASITDSIPWINLDELKGSVANNAGKNLANVTTADLTDAIAGIMLANHIKLTTLSYPAAAANAGFGTYANVLAMLIQHNSPVTRPVVAQYAVGGWDWFA